MSSGPTILLVDDDEADVMLFRRCCAKAGLTVRVHAARDGMEALDYLRSPAAPQGRMVVVTDLNMPRFSGHELIEAMRADPQLATHVIFVLSTSNLRTDVEASYRCQVAGYVVKDPHGEQLMQCIAMLRNYFCAVTLTTPC